ncbi:LysM domain-containing protein [Paenibacillus albiflavus]|uniref:LysM domain-containing protein n=1 Tax=Paenibacillus albiflavus TaxID=2545760 RepID=A0A4R4E5W2_9BACL|nr:LysM domain-containing protein [Paenibacillus albiflavus]TCZ73058.1 LysM domain-containing protein [Paenibacillus albiflavus]
MHKGYNYTTLAGDTFDSIALDFYNEETHASTIIQMNLQYRNVLIFQGGEKLLIPIIEKETPTSLPPWKRS